MSTREEAGQAGRQSYAGSRAAPARVLVVDDGAEARDLYCECLAYDGFFADAAEDGPDGLSKAVSLRPDLIVLDYSMPRMDGGEVLRRLKSDERTRAIPVIMLTAMPELVRDSVKLDCAAFLEKPCQPDRLMQTISAVLDDRASGQKRGGGGH